MKPGVARTRTLEMLRKADLTVEQIAVRLGQRQDQIRYVLRDLLRGGLVTRRVSDLHGQPFIYSDAQRTERGA